MEINEKRDPLSRFSDQFLGFLCCLEWVNEYYHTPKALNTEAEGSAQRNPRLVIITIENPEGVRQEWEQPCRNR